MSKIATMAFVLVMMAVPFMFACGKATDPTVTVGTAGPTVSGLYFDLTIAPSVIQESGTLSITAHVWIPAGTGTGCVLNVGASSGAVTYANVATPGTGYAIGTILALVNGTGTADIDGATLFGTGAKLVVTAIDSAGGVTGVSVSGTGGSGGTGYTLTADTGTRTTNGVATTIVSKVSNVSVYFTSDSGSNTTVATNTNGFAVATLTTTGSGGFTGWVTAAVEDKSLTASYQIKP